MDWSVLFGTFGVLFLAELGDKTQLAVIAQTCRYRRPWAVFLGASSALAAVTALGVLAGQAIGLLIPAEWIRWVAAAGFLVMGALLAWDSWRPARNATLGDCRSEDDQAARPHPPWQAFGMTFLLLFIAEMGDKTQLAVLALASRSGSPWPIFMGALLALSAVTALGVAGGEGLARILPERWLRRLSGAAFIILGILIGLGALGSVPVLQERT